VNQTEIRRRARRLRLPLTYVALFVLLALRRPDALANAQFWAEDGPIFFHTALLAGLHSLVIPYAGYLSLVGRLVALIALAFPFALQPFVYDFAAIAIAAAVFTLFTSPAYRYLIHSDLARIVIAVVAAVAPFGGEVIGDITNIQWYLSIGALLLILYRPIRSSLGGRALRGGIALISALSAPLTILWVPLVFRILAVPRDREKTTGVLVALGAIGEIVLSSTLAPSAHQPFGLHVLATAILATLSYRVVLPTLFGEASSIALTGVPYLSVVATCAIAAGALFLARTARTRYRLVAIGLWIIAGLALSLIGRNFVTMFGSIRHFSQFGGERYFFVGSVLLVYVIGSTLSERLRDRSAFTLVMAVVFALGTNENYAAARLVDQHWVTEAAQVTAWADARKHGGQTHALSLPINPIGWTIQLPGCESPPAERAEAALVCDSAATRSR